MIEFYLDLEHFLFSRLYSLVTILTSLLQCWCQGFHRVGAKIFSGGWLMIPITLFYGLICNNSYLIPNSCNAPISKWTGANAPAALFSFFPCISFVKEREFWVLTLSHKIYFFGFITLGPFKYYIKHILGNTVVCDWVFPLTTEARITYLKSYSMALDFWH